LVKTSRPPIVTWMKTATWAARSKYQKGIEALSRYHAIPPRVPATAFKRITAQPTTTWTTTIAYIRLRGSGFRLLMRKATM
jgi:hypothetical protein